MEETDPPVQSVPQTFVRKSTNLLIILLITTLGIVVVAIFFLYKQKQNKNLNTENQEQVVSKEETKESSAEKEKKGMIEFFVSDYLPRYSKFKAEVRAESILRVFPLNLKKITEDETRGWLVEFSKDNDNISYYLLTPILEKELLNTKSCPQTQDENPPIELERVDTVGNEGGLGRDLQEKSGYLVLSGSKNSCYGGANAGFVSVYNMRTGEKIKLQGSVGVSKTGNALGKLKGIYGINQPQIMVEYGPFSSAPNTVEELNMVAYFNLQTGIPKQVVDFK